MTTTDALHTSAQSGEGRGLFPAAPAAVTGGGHDVRPGPERAGFGVRVAAALADGALLLPVYLVMVGAFQRAAGAHLFGTRGLRRADPVFLSVFLGNALVLLYNVLEVTRGATPGKSLLRLRITAESGAGASRAQLLARYAIKHGARLCGLAEALTSVRRLRLFFAWAPLAVFRQHPMDFVTLRTVGELLGLFVVVAFFFTLGKSKQSLYDRLTKTAVARRPAGVAKRGFEPVRVLPVEPDEPAARMAVPADAVAAGAVPAGGVPASADTGATG